MFSAKHASFRTEVKSQKMSTAADVRPRTLRNMAHCCGFDRVELWVDTPALPFAIGSLSCKATQHLGSMPYHPNWQLRVDLHQPSQSDLHKLIELETRCGVQIEYAEIALDVVPLHGITPSQLAEQVLGRCSSRSARTKMEEFEGTFYSHPRGEKCLAAYFDKPSKLSDWAQTPSKDCFHMEMRYKGKPALQQVQLVSLRDIFDFDHYNFWRRALHAFEINDTELARLIIAAEHRPVIPGKKAGPRSPAYVAKRWKEKFQTAKQFCLQNAWVDPRGKAILNKLRRTDLWSILTRLDTRITRRPR